MNVTKIRTETVHSFSITLSDKDIDDLKHELEQPVEKVKIFAIAQTIVDIARPKATTREAATSRGSLLKREHSHYA